MTRKTAPYGTWASPITTDLIAGHTLGLGGVSVDGEALIWPESRPWEQGRTLLVRRGADGVARDLTPAPYNVRSRVHEYGGSAYAVRNGTVVFSNFADNRIFRIDPNGEITAVTEDSNQRFADFEFDPAGGRTACVREQHGPAGEPENAIVALDLAGDPAGGRVLANGHDFFAYPRFSPDGKHFAWITWDHPNMPWDATDLWCAEVLADGGLGPAHHVAGGPEVSALEPRWSPGGTLHFVSDHSGWWNLYRWRNGESEALYPAELEFGAPLWGLGTTTYRFLDEERILCTPTDQGKQRLSLLENGRLTALKSPFEACNVPQPFGDRLVVTGASATDPGGLALFDAETGAIEWIKRAAEVTLDPGDVSLAEPFWFPTENGLQAHAFFYPPTNHGYEGPAEEKPPLIVMSHGGPTGATGTHFSLKIQYWTSRGFAVVDVNYGGSTGYGRAYRARLDGAWGLVDTEDCVNAARHLAAEGRVDGARMAIRGQSAGGYTTLSALTFHDVFAAGTSQYGVGDLKALAEETHKFESRYLDRLLGPLPESEAVYKARSPLAHADRLNCPVLFLQGLDDKIVPPNQAETMAAALKAKGVPVAHIAFEGEGHGFRQSANIKRALEAELAFYGRVFGFTPADAVVPLAIDNLD
ncbi:MAG: S9 family peptidase [Pseudomonadota bacterium]